jgi:LPS-assembly protein
MTCKGSFFGTLSAHIRRLPATSATHLAPGQNLSRPRHRQLTGKLPTSEGLLAPGPPPLLRGVIRRLALLTAVALAASLAHAQDRDLNISSDLSTTDVKTNEQVLTGHARVTDGITLLTADEIRVSVPKGEILTAIGNVVYTKEDGRLLADRLTLDRSKQTFSAQKVRFGAFPYYAEAESAEGSFKEITFLKATVSYGEPGRWQPTARADKVIYAPHQRLRTENGMAGIGSAQPVPFPKFQQDLKQNQSLLSLASFNGGYRSSLGAFVEAGIHLPASERFRVGGDLGIYSNRGILFGPGGSYGGGEDSTVNGYFRSGYINDHGEKKTDVLGFPVPEDRGYIEWQHQQKLGEHFELTAQLNYWSDSEILRDFRPRAFYPVQTPDNFVEAVYTGKNYFISAFGRFQPNNFNLVQERLPEIRFDLLPTTIGNGFVERFNASFAILRERVPSEMPYGYGYALRSEQIAYAYGLTPSTTLSNPYSYYRPYVWLPQKSNRLDAYYSISRPFKKDDWFSFTPILGGRVTSYLDDSLSSLGREWTRTLGEVGFDAALSMSGTFDYKNEQWKINGLRHLFSPKLSYRSINGDTLPIPLSTTYAIDRSAFSTYLQPLGLGDRRNIDDLQATNVLRVGFDNTLQTRDENYGSRDLLTLNVAGDFFIDKRRYARGSTSLIHTELAAAPTRWLSLNIYENFDPNRIKLQEFNSGLTLHDADAWSVRFSNNYLRTQINDFQLDGRFRINETYEALTRLHYDVRKRRFNEQAYGVTQNLGNTWLVSYIVTLYSGPRRESHFGLNVQIAARAF